MVDILDAAQNNTQTPPPPPPVEPPPAPPMPPVNDMPTPPLPPPTPMGSDDLVVPPLPEEPKTESSLPGEVKPPEPPREDKPKKKRMSPAMIITGIILLLITVPLAGLVVKNSTEIRSQAGKINTAKAQKAIVKLQSDKAQKAYADARIQDEANAAKGIITNLQGSTDVGKAVAALTAAAANPANSSGTNATPKPVVTPSKYLTVTFECGNFSGNARALCIENNDYAQTQTNPGGTAPTLNSADPATVGQAIANVTCNDGDTKCKQDVENQIITQMKQNQAIPNPAIGKPCTNGSNGGQAGVYQACGVGAMCDNDTHICIAVTPTPIDGQPCQVTQFTDTCGTGAACSHDKLIGGQNGVGGVWSGTCTTVFPSPLLSSCATCMGSGGTDSSCASKCTLLNTTPAANPTDRPICTTGHGCPTGWTCDGDVVPGTQGSSFASRYCNPPPTSAPGGGGSSGGGGGNNGGGGEGGSQCVSIVAYDSNGNALSSTDLAALHPGDTVTFGYAPGGSATKVRFQVNSGSWNETTSRNPNNNAQFTWTYTLDNTTNFSIAAQWFDGTNWNQ